MKNKILTEGFPFSEGILSGKTAVVCGASEGIGRATALLLARSGARVITLARNQIRLEELITEMHGTGHKTLSIDLEDTKAVEGAVAVLRGRAGVHTHQQCWRTPRIATDGKFNWGL